MLGRLFCFSGENGGRHGDWGSQSQFGQLAAATARGRVLEVLEEELEERFSALGLATPTTTSTGALASGQQRSSQDAGQLRRLYKANLPAADLTHCKDLLRKLAAIDGAREAAETEQKGLQGQLRAAEQAIRQAEFARARAEAIATARGEALMHAQAEATKAKAEVAQLEEVLQLALPRLGIDITPAGQPMPVTPPSLQAAGGAGGGRANVPQVQQSVFSKQQLTAVAASLTQLPRQSLAGAAARQHLQPREQLRDAQHAQQQRRRAAEAMEGQENWQLQQRLDRQQQGALGAQQQLQQRRHAARHSQGGGRDQETAVVEVRQDSQTSQQLQGFTVYTNSLQSEEYGGEADEEQDGQGEVAQRPLLERRRPQALQPPLDVPTGGGEPDSRGSGSSGVQWRSISSAALSRSASLEAGAGRELQHGEHSERGRRSAPTSRAGSRPTSLHRGAGADTKLQQQGHHLPQLMLPTTHASQPDSLVRIGASLQSPELMPLQEEDEDAFAQQLPPGRQPAPGARWGGGAHLRPDGDAGSRIGSRRTSQDGASHPASMEQLQLRGGPAEQAWGRRAGSEPPAAGAGRRAGSEPPAALQIPAFVADGKVAGAGTWLSPSLADMIAHKKRQGQKSLPGMDDVPAGGEPSPPSHIKAVFGTSQDKAFYGPMAAHLHKREQPANVRRPAAPAAAPAAGGPARQGLPSNRSSHDGNRGAAQQHHSSRQAALLPPQQQQQQQLRRSSVALSELGGQAVLGSGTEVPDENLAAAALGRAAVRGSGGPLPRQQQRQPGAPTTKRSLDSAGAGPHGGSEGPGASSIAESLNAVEAAMAALRDANPQLSQQHVGGAAGARTQQQPYQQQHQQLAHQGKQQYGRMSSAAGGVPPAVAQHVRTRSMEHTALDLPLRELGGDEQQRRWREEQLRLQQRRW